MRAWPAADELRTDGFLDAVLGVAMLVGALILGATPLWLLAPAAVLLVLARTPIRHMSKQLEGTYPAPPDVTVRGRVLVIARQAPEPLLFAAVITFVAVTVAPLLLGFAALTSFFGAAISLGRARVIRRWQVLHGGRVLRHGAFAETDVYYVAH